MSPAGFEIDGAVMGFGFAAVVTPTTGSWLLAGAAGSPFRVVFEVHR